MRITVLGKSPAWQDAGGACSGYVVEHGGTRLLLECGNGVFGRLREHCSYRQVDAVVISHLHADHCLDLMPYAYALTYGQAGPVAGGAAADRPALLLPEYDGLATIRRLAGLWGSETLIEEAFAPAFHTPGGTLEIGELRLRFVPVPHYVPTCAIDIAPAAGGPRFTFGADCGPNEAVVDLARGSELLFLEATLERPEASGPRGHLTAAEAGELARRAAVRRLVLTHLSDELDQQAALEAASHGFGAPVEIARAGAEYVL